MTEEKPMTIVEDGQFAETIEPPLDDKDAADVAKLNGEAEHRPILEVWREVLEGGRAEAKHRISPAWASRITSMYPQVKVQDMATFKDQYFGKIEELHQHLLFVMETDKKITQQTTIAEDLEHNRVHYIQVITLWQTAVLNWELEWDCTDVDAHVELAAISEAHKFFFGAQGLIALLEQIELKFTEDDTADLMAVLEEFKGEHE